jgi:hypothetical protein
MNKKQTPHSRSGSQFIIHQMAPLHKARNRSMRQCGSKSSIKLNELRSKDFVIQFWGKMTKQDVKTIGLIQKIKKETLFEISCSSILHIQYNL